MESDLFDLYVYTPSGTDAKQANDAIEEEEEEEEEGDLFGVHLPSLLECLQLACMVPSESSSTPCSATQLAMTWKGPGHPLKLKYG